MGKTFAPNKERASQLPLWEEEPLPEVHHLMKVIHFDGRRYIIDTACPACTLTLKDRTIWSAQFVEKSRTGCCHRGNT
jgi:hypothetical protein